MTQEDKELLLKDLCARLPYRVFVKWKTARNPAFIKNIGGEKLIICREYSGFAHAWECCIEDIKPYLRPMSSMNEEEFKEYHSMLIDIDQSGLMIQKLITKVVDWLDHKMFDHRGLIPKSLALEAPEGMYK